MYKVRVGTIGSPVPMDLPCTDWELIGYGRALRLRIVEGEEDRIMVFPLNRIEAFTVTAWEEPSK